MFCPNCGTEFPEDAQFCMKCGAKQPQSQPEPKPSAESSAEQVETQAAPEENNPEHGAVQQPQQRKPVREMTEEELLADGKARIKRAVRNVIIGLVGFCLLLLVVRLFLPEPRSVIDASDLPSAQASSETVSESGSPMVTDEPAEDRYTISYESGEAFFAAAEQNMGRFLALYEGDTVRINDLEIDSVDADKANVYSDSWRLYFVYFQNDSDLYSLNAGARVTIDAVISRDWADDVCLVDCVLIDVENNEYGYVDDVMSSEYGTHSKMDGSSTIGFSVYTGEGSGFILDYYGADSSASNMVFSVSTPYSNSSDNGSVIYFYDSLGNGLILTVVSPGTISISCDSSTFEGISSSTLDGTYYITESYINPMA